MRRLLLALVGVVAAVVLAGSGTDASATPSSRGASADLASRLSRALVARGISARRTSAFAIDLRTGAVAYDRNGAVPLAPASTEKLAVAYTALRLLGPAFRFRTDLVGAGTRDGSVWRGDLFLVGHGDPTLALPDLDRLAHRVALAGIRHVTGRVFGDERYFDRRRDAPGWKPSFLGIESQPLSALSVHGAVQRGADGSAPAAAEALIKALERRGVSVAGPPGRRGAPGDAVPIAADSSVPLATVVRHMDQQSDNFYAETILKDLGAAFGGSGTTTGGAAVVARALAEAQVPLRGVRLADGSGLSLDDRLTTQSLVAILRTGAADPATRDSFVGSLSVAGVSGTLERRLEGAATRGSVVGKTGTTNEACALAGFVKERYAFAILQNGSPVPYWTARAAQDRFVTVLATS